MIMSPESIGSVIDPKQIKDQKNSIDKDVIIAADQSIRSLSIENSPGKLKRHHSKTLNRQSEIKDDSPTLSSTSTTNTSTSHSSGKSSSSSFFGRLFSRGRHRNYSTKMSQLTEHDELEMGEKSRQMVTKLRRSSSLHLDALDIQDEVSVFHNDATLDHEGDLRIAQATPTLNVVTSEVSILKEAYNDLLEMAQEVVEDRLKLERILAQSTKLENLDDLDLAEQYLTSMAETLEVSRRELSKLNNIAREMKEYATEEQLQQQSYSDLGLMLHILTPGEQMILTRLDNDISIDDESRITSIDGQLYSVIKKIDNIDTPTLHSPQSHSSNSSSNGLISINAKLAQDLSLAQKRIADLEQAQAQEQSLKQATVTELHNQVTTLHHQLSMAKLAVERHTQDRQALLDRLKVYEENFEYTNQRQQNHIDIEHKMPIENPLHQKEQFEKVGDTQPNQSLNKEDNSYVISLKQQIDSIERELETQKQAYECRIQVLMKELDSAKDQIASFQAHCNYYDHVRAVYLTFLQRPDLRDQTTTLLREMFEYDIEELQTGQVKLKQDNRPSNAVKNERDEKEGVDLAIQESDKLEQDKVQKENNKQYSDSKVNDADALQDEILTVAGNSLTYNL